MEADGLLCVGLRKRIRIRRVWKVLVIRNFGVLSQRMFFGELDSQ